jgi:hypothetical protein
MTTEPAIGRPAPTGILPFGAPVDPADEAAVRATIDDYFLGWYDADPERARRAMHPDLAKRGYEREADGSRTLSPDTALSMVELTAAGRGRRTDPAERAYEVRVVEIHDAIATAICHSVPYIEYLHLIRTPDGWRILNALWQRP